MLDSLPDVCTISRRTQTTDSQGGYTETWATASTTTCRVVSSNLTPEERATADRLSLATAWVVILPALTDVTAADRIVVGSRTFEVAAVLAPKTWEVGRRVLCKEIS
jgi:SPP1 family predicted phage head-tail adaptor